MVKQDIRYAMKSWQSMTWHECAAAAAAEYASIEAVVGNYTQEQMHHIKKHVKKPKTESIKQNSSNSM